MLSWRHGHETPGVTLAGHGRQGAATESRTPMMPIQDLLNRIRWDDAFAAAEFEIGYLDRQWQRIVRLPLAELWFEAEDHFAFHCYDRHGEEHAVPLHRIKDVYRNGRLIWHGEH